ncbi:uncharacterized protein LOC144174497 [Haemaphysalis longicornis]
MGTQPDWSAIAAPPSLEHKASYIEGRLRGHGGTTSDGPMNVLLFFVQTEIASLKKVVAEQQTKLIELEDRSRRRNLIIFGISERDDENTGSLKQRILHEVFQQKLNVTATTVERIHWIGKKSASKPRPVILNFFDYNEKMEVLKNCSKLKGTNISVNHDFSKATITKRSKLWQYGKQFKEQGHKVALDYDRLRVDDNVYVWDETLCQPRCVYEKNREITSSLGAGTSQAMNTAATNSVRTTS